MPGIIILLIFNEQLRLVFGATPLQDELARSAKMIEDTVYGFPSEVCSKNLPRSARSDLLPIQQAGFDQSLDGTMTHAA